MAKYDAFGREIGEDTLAGLGARPGAAPAPATPAAPERSVPTLAPPHRRRRRRGRGLAFLVIAIGVTAQLVTSDSDDSPSTSPPSIVTGAAPADAPSLLAPGRFAKALDEMRAADLGRPFTLRLDANGIFASFVTADEKIRVVQVSRALGVKTLADSAAATPGLQTFALDELRPGAPGRLMRAAMRRLHQPRSNVDYLVADHIGDGLTWLVYFKNGRYALGDARGRLEQVF